MNDMMKFPDTVEEFMEQYKITDTEQIYTNGTELVPIFRMKQWFEHLPSAESETHDNARKTHACVSPCDICRHYPPSSADGKPCSMCPAEGRTDG